MLLRMAFTDTVFQMYLASPRTSRLPISILVGRIVSTFFAVNGVNDRNSITLDQKKFHLMSME